jgi:hypothetical protein
MRVLTHRRVADARRDAQDGAIVVDQAVMRTHAHVHVDNYPCAGRSGRQAHAMSRCVATARQSWLYVSGIPEVCDVCVTTSRVG